MIQIFLYFILSWFQIDKNQYENRINQFYTVSEPIWGIEFQFQTQKEHVQQQNLKNKDPPS